MLEVILPYNWLVTEWATYLLSKYNVHRMNSQARTPCPAYFLFSISLFTAGSDVHNLTYPRKHFGEEDDLSNYWVVMLLNAIKRAIWILCLLKLWKITCHFHCHVIVIVKEYFQHINLQNHMKLPFIKKYPWNTRFKEILWCKVIRTK